MKQRQQKQKENEFPGLFRGVMLAHLILLLHVLLLAVVGILVIFFRGLITYMPLILISGLLLLAAGAYALFRWMKARGKRIRDILNSPALSGKSFEIKLLGGVASIKVDSRGDERALPAIHPASHPPLQLDQKSARVIELPDFSRETPDESANPAVNNRTKRRLFKWKN